MGKYVPNTDVERRAMLDAIGLTDIKELYSMVPAEVRLDGLDLPDGMSELEVSKIVSGMADKNKVYRSIFRGAGAYNHYIPAIVNDVTSKEEFVTTYTPYQAEVSQGVLQSIFEYQTMICELTDMDASNASVYDGATAAAEAITMCVERKKSRMLVSGATNPMTLRVMQTYCDGANRELAVVPTKDGLTDLSALKELMTEDTCGVFIQQPNYFGLIEDAEKAAEIAHEGGAKFVMGVNPIAAMALKSPRECGADIVTGEGQPLGIPMSFGGPYLGFMATLDKNIRRLPGRIVGETVDVDGKRGYVLTLQAREQHIRREKATSNICSNQALCAMRAAVYMTTMGTKGIKAVAEHCYSKAHYAAEEMAKIAGFELVYGGEFFNEFVTKATDVDKVLARLDEEGILGGYPVGDGILWCFTEMNSKADIDELIKILKEVA